MNTGLIGGIVGSVIGLAGGLIGAYFSIKNTKGPQERAFVIKMVAVCWIAIILFLFLLFILPPPYRWFMWIPYGILLPLGIVYWNIQQQKIRQNESPHPLQPTPLRDMTKP